MPRHIARWDLDKTYLRTEFDTVRDIVRTAFERADEKRAHPGAATLLRELGKGGISIHILSGSPEQMRRRLEAKLRLDGIVWDSFTLKPNLSNLLRLRFRAVRDQLGYKLPALLAARARVAANEQTRGAKETLFGDDAEADAFVYSLYADVVEGRFPADALIAVCKRGRMYSDVLAEVEATVVALRSEPVVERVLIHLERQSSPEDFDAYGTRVVPFYNYLQASIVLVEDGRLPAIGLLRVASELLDQHRFDGARLAKSYRDLVRRGHVRGLAVPMIQSAFEAMGDDRHRKSLGVFVDALPSLEAEAQSSREARAARGSTPDYLALVDRHNPRR